MLTSKEIQSLMVVTDAGIKAHGLAIFNNNGGVALQSALNKLEAMHKDAARIETAERLAEKAKAEAKDSDVGKGTGAPTSRPKAPRSRKKSA